MNVLIIEDEKELAKSICTYLSEESFVCDIANDFNSAIEKTLSNDYDCLILDINLPDGSGLEILSELKKNYKTEGVLIVSARHSTEDKVAALKTGADDYLTKPFHLSELSARVHAIIRRKAFHGHTLLNVHNFSIDLNAKTVTAPNGKLDLTRKEMQLLLYFIANKNRVITKAALAEHLWGEQMSYTANYDFLYTHIKNLRRKMVAGGATDCIESVYGTGYKLSE